MIIPSLLSRGMRKERRGEGREREEGGERRREGGDRGRGRVRRDDLCLFSLIVNESNWSKKSNCSKRTA